MLNIFSKGKNSQIIWQIKLMVLEGENLKLVNKIKSDKQLSTILR